jgi:hypothetical protein
VATTQNQHGSASGENSLSARHPTGSSPDWGSVLRSLTTLEAVFKNQGGFETEIEKIAEKRTDLERRQELLVFVVGEGNFGKSSIINRLLGRDVAEVSRFPKTWCVDLFHALPAGVEEYASIRRSGRKEIERMPLAQAISAYREQEHNIEAIRAQIELDADSPTTRPITAGYVSIHGLMFCHAAAGANRAR